jgi:succinate dehydrogenase / fumarate reductase cytochrome b subunit
MATTPSRPVFRNIHITQIARYKMPLAARVSILHRVSGALMFVLLPFIIWMFDTSLSSEISFESFSAAFESGVGFVPGWFVKLVALAVIWAYLHHFCAGLRHLWMDVDHHISKPQAHATAVTALATTLVLTAALGAKLFGLY